MKGLFIELWHGVRDLMQDNNTSGSQFDAKRFINWTLEDVSNEYNFGCLQDEMQITTTADGQTIDLTQIHQISATAEIVYAFSDDAGDGGSVIQVFGKRINTDGTYDITADSMTLIATATATGGISWSHIDSMRRAAGSGTVTLVTSTGATLCTLGAESVYVANDVQKVTAISDTTNNYPVNWHDYSTERRGSPNLTYDNIYGGADTWHEGKIKLMNVASGTNLNLVYQKIPRPLVKDIDRSEFPYYLYGDIINYAYEVYGLRYQDEADAWNGKARKEFLLQEIVRKYTQGKQQSKRFLPAGVRRRL